MSDCVPAIEARGLAHSYRESFWGRRRRRIALDSLDLVAGEGLFFGFLAANGPGKTTTIKILVGLQEQSGGEAEIFGLHSSDVECRPKIGFMPENLYFHEYLTARKRNAWTMITRCCVRWSGKSGICPKVRSEVDMDRGCMEIIVRKAADDYSRSGAFFSIT